MAPVCCVNAILAHDTCMCGRIQCAISFLWCSSPFDCLLGVSFVLTLLLNHTVITHDQQPRHHGHWSSTQEWGCTDWDQGAIRGQSVFSNYQQHNYKKHMLVSAMYRLWAPYTACECHVQLLICHLNQLFQDWRGRASPDINIGVATAPPCLYPVLVLQISFPHFLQ